MLHISIVATIFTAGHVHIDDYKGAHHTKHSVFSSPAFIINGGHSKLSRDKAHSQELLDEFIMVSGSKVIC